MNNIYYGMPLCSSIQKSHLDKTTIKSCGPSFPTTQKLLPFEVLRHALFDSANGILEQKKACLSDYTKKLQNSPEALNEFRQKLTALWLNKKKAELILRECQSIDAALPYQDHTLPQNQGQEPQDLTDSEKEYLKKNHPKLKIQFYPICRTPQQKKALKALIALTDAAAPFWSGKNIYQVVEENRAMATSAKTGLPVTDAEIMEFDAKSDEPFVKLDRSKVQNFYHSLGSYFEEKVKDRSKLSDQLKSGFSDSNLKKLFDEGSADESLDQLGLSEAASKADPDISRMHYCLKSLYEENMMTELTETIGLFLITKRLLPAGLVTTLSKIGKWTPDSLAMFVGSLPITIQDCKAWKASDLKINRKGEAAPSMNAGALPKEFDIDLLMLRNLPLSSVESCKKLGLNRVYETKTNQNSCAFSAVSSSLPRWPSLAAILIKIKTEP